MPHTSDGRIYIDTSTTPHRGVDVIGDIAYVLGRRSKDVGHLCGDTDDPMNGGVVDTGNKINKWSKYKPVEVNKVGIITEEDRRNANHGFKVDSGTDSIYEYSIPALFSRYDLNGGEYKYIRPTTKFRVLDFVPPSLSGYGYRHSAPAPFVYNNPSSGSGTVVDYTINININSSADAEISIGDIVYNNPALASLSSMYIALAVKYTKGNTTYYKICRAHTMTETPVERTLATFVKGEGLQADVQLDGFRTYQMMWVATEVDPSDPSGAGASIYLPLGGFSYTWNQASQNIYYTFAWNNSTPPVGGTDLSGYAIINFSATFANITMGSTASESRTATIYSTPRIHLQGGSVITGDRIQISSPGAVTLNTTNVQTVETGYVSSIRCTVGGEGVPVADMDYIELITQVDIDAGGSTVISLANINGDQIDEIRTF